MEETGFVLSNTADQKAIPLKGVTAEIELAGLLAHTLIRQRFRNDGKRPIEAMYSFPVPTDAVLLGLEIEIAGHTLHGVVQEKKQASERYEDAIVSGNGACMLKKLDDGHFQMNVGNLKPGETVELRVRYAQILRWSGDTLRYRLPTVIAPHYGDPRRAGIDEQDAPTTATLVEYPFVLTARLSGALAAAEISCPTNRAALSLKDGAVVLTLDPSARLDRDFILTVRSKAAAPWEVLCAPDGDQYAVLGCLNAPAQEDAGRAGSHDLTILIDCSGSMDGDSIAQARRAMLTILDELRDGDTLSIVRFGSQTDVWTPKPVMVDARTRSRFAEKVSTLEANLGGTEILGGLREALKRSRPGADILLVTDGEAHVSTADITAIARKGHRIFTVGVGSAVSEKLLRQLADQSGGFCELVTPNEQMADRIAAHARRMRSPRSKLTLDWGVTAVADAALPDAVFDGDTVSLPALLGARPRGSVYARLAAEESTREFEVRVTDAAGDLAAVLPRVVAWTRLPKLTDADATALAVRYQLVTDRTAMVAVLERADDEKADGLPDLAKVPQMLAAGWGGMGQVNDRHAYCMSIDESYEQYESPAVFRNARAGTRADAVVSQGVDRYDVPAFLRKQSDSDEDDVGDLQPTPANWIASIQRYGIGSDGKLALSDATTLRRMMHFSLPGEVDGLVDEIAGSVQPGRPAAETRSAVLLALADWLLATLGMAAKRDSRGLRVAIKASIGDAELHEILKARIGESLSGTTGDLWCVHGLVAV